MNSLLNDCCVDHELRSAGDELSFVKSVNVRLSQLTRDIRIFFFFDDGSMD